MSNKKYIILAVSVLFLGFLLYADIVKAAEVHLTPNQVEHVRSTCATTESSINQLHSNDALLRVNVGQNYESISTRLIKRFNSRVSFNNLNNSDLVTATNEYDKSLDIFRNSYRDYEVSLSTLSSMECEANPGEFYSLLENTRAKRFNVRNSIQAINERLQNYADEVNNFDANYRTVAGQNGN